MVCFEGRWRAAWDLETQGVPIVLPRNRATGRKQAGSARLFENDPVGHAAVGARARPVAPRRIPQDRGRPSEKPNGWSPLMAAVTSRRESEPQTRRGWAFSLSAASG